MNKYVLFFSLFLSALFISSCATVVSSQSAETKEISDYTAKSVSFSVTASWLDNDSLHIEKGMAVVIMATKNKCLLATAKHIVKNASLVTVVPLDEKLIGLEMKVDVVYLDDLEDIAFLSFNTSQKHITPKVVLDENVLIGKTIIAFKHLRNNECQITKGRIIDFWKLPNNKKYMVAEMLIEEGFSGGGAFDDDGNLIGLISGKNMDQKFKIAYLISGPKIVAALQRFL